MDIIKAVLILQLIAASEINYQIQYFFDSGYTVKLGDPANGFKEVSPLCVNYVEVAEWLTDAARRHYPASEFIKHWADLWT